MPLIRSTTICVLLPPPLIFKTIKSGNFVPMMRLLPSGNKDFFGYYGSTSKIKGASESPSPQGLICKFPSGTNCGDTFFDGTASDLKFARLTPSSFENCPYVENNVSKTINF
uniref:Uncharacterized protein n=1 Tax=Romanomermis culicivorax TaxID=13658 RepID=A0A915L7K1_ROMCU